MLHRSTYGMLFQGQCLIGKYRQSVLVLKIKVAPGNGWFDHTFTIWQRKP